MKEKELIKKKKEGMNGTKRKEMTEKKNEREISKNEKRKII